VIGWRVFQPASNDVLSSMGVTRALFAPGVEFDQQRNHSDHTKDIDYLGFRFIGELQKENADPYQILRYSGYIKTDSRGDSKIWGGYAEWEPRIPSLGIGGGHTFYENSSAMYSFLPILHAEAERVADAGILTNVKAGDEYLRAGPILQANLWFVDGPLSNLNFSGQFRQLWNVAASGQQKTIQYLQGDAGYNFDKAGNTALGITYRQGNLPSTGKQTRDFKTALTIKY
jgi:hypothetical protein